MNINRKSWHYRLYARAYKFNRSERLYSEWGNNEPKTLCAYFWGFIWHVLLASVSLAIIATALSLIALHIPLSLYSWLHNHSRSARDFLLAELAIVTVLTVIVLVTIGYVKVRDKLEDKAHAAAEGDLTFTGVVLNKLVAGKRKVCPILSYKD